MIYSNINLGVGVEIDPSSSINNIKIGNNVKIAKRVSAFGSKEHPLEIGEGSRIAMNAILNGYGAKLTIGNNVGIGHNANIMTDSGPNFSTRLQRIFPIEQKEVTIGSNCWIGASSIIMPGVSLGDFCIVAAGSFVKTSFDSFSIIGGTPARLIRKFTEEEIKELLK